MQFSTFKTAVTILAISFVFISCSKGGGGGNNPPAPTEENLSIGIDPDPGSGFAKALGASYDFKLEIKSKMPAQGVEGTVVFRREADNSVLSTQNISGSTSPINITISNIAFSEVGIVAIDLKSKSKPTNTVNKTFKLHRK